MLRPSRPLAAACSIAALIAATPSLAQDKSADASSFVPPNAISMPTSGPTFDTPMAVIQTPAPQMPVAAPDFTPPPVQAPAPTVAVPQPAPAYTLAPEIEQRLARERSTNPGDRADRDAAAKFYAARNGEPIWMTPNGTTAAARGLAAEIAAADAYGLEPKAYRLPAFDNAASEPADIEVTLTLAALKYARHARGGRTNPEQLSPFIDRKPQLLAPTEVLTQLAASSAPDRTLAGFNPQARQFQALRAKLADLRAGRQQATAIDTATAAPTPPAKGSKSKSRPQQASQPRELSGPALEKKLIANMEMWRWMPELGNYHIQANIPEFQFRMVRDGKVIHTERMIVGKQETQTPLFSETMKVLVFQPTWNVPNGIKIRDLLPQLARNRGALARAGLKANYGNKEIDPATVDFSSVDIRNLHIFQPPGPSNAMGQVKFLFPNKHDIYMHDTPMKNLFNASGRTLSNGCMRVRDPLKFAEIILANDKGWDRSRIMSLTTTGSANQEIRLSQPIPVHMTYFTAWVDDAGTLKLANDTYGHETRVHMGLDGKAHLIPKPKPLSERPVLLERRAVPISPFGGGSGGEPNWLQKLFSF